MGHRDRHQARGIAERQDETTNAIVTTRLDKCHCQNKKYVVVIESMAVPSVLVGRSAS